MKEKTTYFGRMAHKIIGDQAIENFDNIKDENVRLAIMQLSTLKPMVECLNDLDKRLRELEQRQQIVEALNAKMLKGGVLSEEDRANIQRYHITMDTYR